MGLTILVVDDNQLYRTTFCALLQSYWPDAHVVEADDGSHALALLLRHPWDVILLDYQLPGLNGGDLVRRMRARARAQGVALAPVVLMSSQPDVAYFTRALGAVAFLPKPVAIAELRAVLNQHAPAKTALQRVSAPAPRSPVAALPTQPRPAQPAGQAPASAGASPPRVRVSTMRAELLRATIQDLFQETLRCYPPPYAPVTSEPPAEQACRVGEYLARLGYLTPRQLARALQITRNAAHRERAPLGRILIDQDLVPPPVLIAVLLQQFRDRLAQDARTAPRFLGEQLLIRTQLTPAQLALALHGQIDRYRQGGWVRLGALIVRHGWLDPSTIRAIVRDQTQIILPDKLAR